MISKLKKKIAIYEEASISVTFEENPFAVCIITPLMKRANESPSSANLVFVDSTSTCDGENHTITFFLTLCHAGAVPIGIVITKGQTEQAYISGFTLLKGLLALEFKAWNS
ncbi:hypothetical protein JTE90_005373 [Oedothorax gibbosus]|uniref:MULE transposase domain-containing protein n=1 Tax=Oedothorax gibbosus TaxID=931172 RepID=A0AAV6TLI7_9ARAC|nr:hypothetical protein JTE90_005373 [Oedothorax gibbosus]